MNSGTSFKISMENCEVSFHPMTPLLLVPYPLRQSVLAELHDGPLEGHLGEDKMYSKGFISLDPLQMSNTGALPVQPVQHGKQVPHTSVLLYTPFIQDIPCRLWQILWVHSQTVLMEAGTYLWQWTTLHDGQKHKQF